MKEKDEKKPATIRPLDALNEMRGKHVNVLCLNGDTQKGILVAFDIHVNVVLDVLGQREFIRGGNVRTIRVQED